MPRIVAGQLWLELGVNLAPEVAEVVGHLDGLCLASDRQLSCLQFMQVETLSIRISKAERAALRARARQDKVSQGLLVRKALRAYGVVPKENTAPSAYDLVKHLIGKNKGGPGDLSTNPKYMEGFGR